MNGNKWGGRRRGVVGAERVRGEKWRYQSTSQTKYYIIELVNLTGNREIKETIAGHDTTQNQVPPNEV